MAGPRRAWEICDDPAHAWIRETWATQEVDPRLPFGRSPTSKLSGGER
jgi:5-deoxy-glucuronate isomerase